MLDWWTALPWYLRAGVALLLMATGVLMFFFSPIKRASIALAVLGFVLLMLSFPSDSEKQGYHF